MLLKSVLQRPASLTDVDLGARSTGDPVHNTRSLLWWPAPDIGQSQRLQATTTKTGCCVQDPLWNVPQGLHRSDWQDAGAPT